MAYGCGSVALATGIFALATGVHGVFLATALFGLLSGSVAILTVWVADRR